MAGAAGVRERDVVGGEGAGPAGLVGLVDGVAVGLVDGLPAGAGGGGGTLALFFPQPVSATTAQTKTTTNRLIVLSILPSRADPIPDTVKTGHNREFSPRNILENSHVQPT